MLTLSPDDTEFLARVPDDDDNPIWTVPVVLPRMDRFFFCAPADGPDVFALSLSLP